MTPVPNGGRGKKKILPHPEIKGKDTSFAYA